MDKEKWMPIKMAMALLSISRSRVLELLRNGTLYAIKSGNQIFIEIEGIEKYNREQK